MRYFAYGATMDPTRMDARDIAWSDRRHGVLEGWTLRFNKVSEKEPGRAAANIEPKDDGRVEGALYEVEEDDLYELDRHEPGYERITVDVEVDDGSTVEAWVHVAQDGHTQDGLRPSKRYVEHLLGGRDLVSKEYYQQLKNIEEWVRVAGEEGD